MMDNSAAQSVEQTFGKTFLQFVFVLFIIILITYLHFYTFNSFPFSPIRYCLHNKILLKRDKCGAFEVSGTSNNIRTLSNCLYIIDNIKSETNKKLKKLQKEALAADYSPCMYYILNFIFMIFQINFVTLISFISLSIPKFM